MDTVCVAAEVDKKLRFVSIYPELEGVVSDVTVEDIYSWENKVEGEVAISNDGSSQVMSYFLREFAVDSEKLKAG